MRQATANLFWTALSLLLPQSVDQLDGREETDALVTMINGLDTNCRGDMRFARAGTDDENDVVGLVEEVTAMKLTHQRARFRHAESSAPCR